MAHRNRSGASPGAPLPLLQTQSGPAGIRGGNVTLTNGPLVEIELDATGSTALSASVRLPEGESCRAAARGRTNPVYAPCGERPLMLRRAREVFPGEDTRRRFFRDAETAPGKLKAPLESR